jgi:hypothetical protein
MTTRRRLVLVTPGRFDRPCRITYLVVGRIVDSLSRTAWRYVRSWCRIGFRLGVRATVQGVNFVVDVLKVPLNRGILYVVRRGRGKSQSADSENEIENVFSHWPNLLSPFLAAKFNGSA